MARKPSKIENQVSGTILILMGIGCVLFAQSHSPNMGLGEMLAKPNSFILKEPVYYGVILLGALMVIGGIINIVNSFKSDKDDKK